MHTQMIPWLDEKDRTKVRGYVRMTVQDIGSVKVFGFSMVRNTDFLDIQKFRRKLYESYRGLYSKFQRGVSVGLTGDQETGYYIEVVVFPIAKFFGDSLPEVRVDVSPRVINKPTSLRPLFAAQCKPAGLPADYHKKLKQYREENRLIREQKAKLLAEAAPPVAEEPVGPPAPEFVPNTPVVAVVPAIPDIAEAAA